MFKEEFLQDLIKNISKSMPIFKFSNQRMLLWNTIIRNSKLNSLNYIHLYIENFKEILNSEDVPTNAKTYIKNIILKNKIKDMDSCFKIRLMLDGFDEDFLFNKKTIQKDDKKKIKRDIEFIIEKLYYSVEIFDIVLIEKRNKIQTIDIFIKENYIPIKYS